MAEFGSHLTSTRSDGEDDETPSIFDVLAQESLLSSLRPAMRHLLRILAERYPSRLGHLYAFHDEVYTTLYLLLEQHYLRHYGGTFSENFYGMKRKPDPKLHKENMLDVKDNNYLPTSCYLKSLFLVVLVPYVKTKCDEWYEHILERKTAGHLAGQKWTDKLCHAFLGIYPYLNMAWEGSLFTYQLLYCLGKMTVHSPLLNLARVHLHYMQKEDMQKQPVPLEIHNKSWTEKIQVLFRWIIRVIVTALSSGLSVSVFFLQFLEWWYSTDTHAASLTALPTPPPSQVPVPESVPKLHTMCPLCCRVRTNDTVLSVTGYVFCYPCIYRFVRENGCCPITSYPAQTTHLIKLYLQHG